MSNDRVRVIFVDNYPMVNGNCSRMPHLHVTRECPRPGMAVEIIYLLANYLNLTIDIQPKAYDSNFNYMFDMIQSNETDLIANFFMNTTRRARTFDFSKELYLAYPIIAVKKADRSLKNILSFFNVYCSDAWLSMLGVFILFTFFGLTVRYFECRLKLSKNQNFTEILWKMTRFQLFQTESINYKLISGQSSLLIFSVFQICIILGLFQGLILSSVVKKVKSAPFSINDDIPQMIKSRKFTIVTSSLVDWYFQETETSSSSPFFELRDALKYNGYKIVKNDDKVLELVGRGNGYITVLQDDYPTLFNKAKKNCDLVYIKNFFPPSFAHMMFRKGSHFVSLFDEAITANKIKIEKIKQKYLDYGPPSHCSADDGRPAPLTMAPYFGLLFVFFVGISVACFIFTAELLKFDVFGPLRINEDKNESSKFEPERKNQLTEHDLPRLITLDENLAAKLSVVAGLPQGSKFFVSLPPEDNL